MFFDDNSISIDGSTELSSSDDIKKRFQSYNWNYLKIDGHSFEEINNAIFEAKKSLLCNWCYFWEECEVMSTPNPSKKI